MATITKTLSLRDTGGRSEIILRFSGGRDCTFRIKSGIFIPRSRWSGAEQRVTIPRMGGSEQREALETRRKLDDLCEYLTDSFLSADRAVITAQWFRERVHEFHHPGSAAVAEDFHGAFARWAATHPRRQEQQIAVLGRELRAFEERRGVSWDFRSADADMLTGFEDYLSGTRKSNGERRGQTTVRGKMVRLRAFFSWARRTAKITDRDPFDGYSIPAAVYGTPYYLTIEEREHLASFDFAAKGRPALGVQRDIFIFQCLVGCRVGDLMRMTPGNIPDGILEYVPAKTNGSSGMTVRVPLTNGAAAIVERYAGAEDGRLLPFVSPQKYNDAIKDMLRLAGLTRMVTVLDPVTRTDVRRPLDEIASSHLARRTFIGNLYRQVKDPALIGSMSGHVEGSRAFARYRSIDDDMKRDVLELLEKKNG